MARKKRKPGKQDPPPAAGTNGHGKTANKTTKSLHDNGHGGSNGLSLPTLIPQPNGKGALMSGGTPGNVGGTGRPRSAIRDRAAQIYDEKGIAFLQTVVDGEKIQQDITDMFGKVHEVKRRPTIRERTEATKLLGHVGLGEHKELTVDDVRNRLQRTITILRKRLTAEELVAAVQEGRAHLLLDSVLNDMRPVWAG